ncbi:MAG: Arm DNA-binding domain-containing protein, partial [Burkholderiaceae bacterium]
MPKLATPLTDIQARNAKPKDKPYKLSDGGGMYLEVMPTGLRVWRMGFTQANGKKNKITFGTYPETSLLEAREKRAAARKQLSDGIDPGQDKKDKNRIKGEQANQ